MPPDTQFRYGGGQWQLAGGVAEMASGETWAELVEATYGPCDLDVLGYSNHYAMAFGDGGISGALSYPTFFMGDVAGSRRKPGCHLHPAEVVVTV